MENKSFIGKTALIIGGTSGMGKASAKALLAAGANVIVASKTPDSISAAVQELQTLGIVQGLQVDLTNAESVAGFIKEVEHIGQIDYLVNASGIFRPKPFLDTTVEDYDALLDINRGFYLVTQAVAKKLKEAGNGGAIVNIGSYWAKQAIKGTPTSAYSMAKAGLHSFTQQIAMELAEDGIRVNAIAPGVVETNVLNGLMGSEDKVKEAYQGLNGIHPLGRNGKADEIAAAVKFLLSEEAAWITGAILDIDGGMGAGRS